MKLYAYWRSSCSYRVRIALGLKGLPYEVEPVPLLEERQKTEEFTARNPSQQVPVLVLDDGTELAQSVAILEYLDEQHPDPALMPPHPVLRARTRQLSEIINSGTQPFQNLELTKILSREHDVDVKAWCIHHIGRGLTAYQRAAERTAGDYSVGDQPTLADCLLIPQLYNARRFGMDVETHYPLLHRIDARCSGLEGFQAAHPDRQPDAQSG